MYLDARTPIGARFSTRFPAITALCHEHQIDPTQDLIPIQPAAHYHMGGIKVDRHGQTTVSNLWACGEVACTGLHGANRLASNSLLEAAVGAEAVAKAIAAGSTGWPKAYSWTEVQAPIQGAAAVTEIRSCMQQHLGVIRTGEGLIKAIRTLSAWEHPAAWLARAVAYAAYKRTDSIGSHWRADARCCASEPQRAWSYAALTQAKDLSVETL